MTPFEMAAAVKVMAAVFTYLNYTLLRLPTAIGATGLTLVASLLLILVGLAVPRVEQYAGSVVQQIDLKQAFLNGMLGFMLFAGALHIDLRELAARRWPIAVLSTVGVLLSTAIVAGLVWGALHLVGVPVRPIYCLLFGALIAPTDPIAVMAILRQAGVPRELEVTIAGESLFNDGVGVVAFLAILEIAAGEGGGAGHLIGLFAWETLGGAVFGFLAGWVVYRMLRSVDNYQLEVLLSVALVAGGYAAANAMHMSGPIAMVVAGLLIGNYGRAYAMSKTTQENLDTFWELIDEVLNATLFVIIGLEVLALKLTGPYLLIGLSAIPIVLFARLVSVSVPLAFVARWGAFPPRTTRILTWGGLRGGISVALALSIPKQLDGVPVAERDIIIAMTYMVVLFSILVQGITLGPLARWWLRDDVGITPGGEDGDFKGV